MSRVIDLSRVEHDEKEQMAFVSPNNNTVIDLTMQSSSAEEVDEISYGPSHPIHADLLPDAHSSATASCQDGYHSTKALDNDQHSCLLYTSPSPRD